MSPKSDKVTHQFNSLAFGSITGTTAGTAIALLTLTKEARILSFENTTNLEVIVTRDGTDFWRLKASTGAISLDVSAAGGVYRAGEVFGVYAASTPGSGLVQGLAQTT